MKLTININPEDILAVTHADDGRAVISMAIGNTVEMHLTVEEQADDVIDMLMGKDDEIKVGDEVIWTEDEDVVIVVTHVYTVNNIEWCDGIRKDGKVYQILTEHARKTVRHFDIQKILEKMKA